MRYLVTVLLLAVSLSVFADEAVKPEPGVTVWNGEAGLGIVIATGNSETKTGNGSLELKNDRINWRHNIKLEALYSEESDIRSAQKWSLGGKTDYKLPENNFLFVVGTYEDDQFSGYDYQASIALGYGRRFIETESLVLDAEIGPGYRHSHISDGESENEGILRLGSKLDWKISESAKFAEGLSIETGEDSTVTKSLTTLSMKINSHFSCKLGLDIKHDSGAPEGSSETDTKTSVTIAYGF